MTGSASHRYTHRVGTQTFGFRDLKDLMAKATPARSGDRLAGVAAGSAQERVVAQMALAELPLATFLSEALIPYEEDEVTRFLQFGRFFGVGLGGELFAAGGGQLSFRPARRGTHRRVEGGGLPVAGERDLARRSAGRMRRRHRCAGGARL